MHLRGKWFKNDKGPDLNLLGVYIHLGISSLCKNTYGHKVLNWE